MGPIFSDWEIYVIGYQDLEKGNDHTIGQKMRHWNMQVKNK